VILNRVRAPGFAKTVCGVVYQGSNRVTGCQFSFTCDGSLRRRPVHLGWGAARRTARRALAGAVFADVGRATHYHTDWMVPYWRDSLVKIARVGTHLFYVRA
jgi:spore germination cell wall hydrolase CwlJ-like protein